MTAPKPMTRAELADKVAKLANLNVENGATESEAALAAAKMQHLLQNYNLTQADLAPEIAAKQNPMATEVVVLASRDSTHALRSQPWKRELAYRLGRTFFVTVMTSRATATFFGAKADVETAAYTFNFLVNVLDPMAQKYTKEQTDKFCEELDIDNKNYLPGDKHPMVVRNSFLDGAVSTVTNALNEENEKFVKSSNKANALVVTRAESARAYALAERPDVFGKKAKGWKGGNGKTNFEAYYDGREAGKTVKVTKGVSSGKKQKQLTA